MSHVFSEHKRLQIKLFFMEYHRVVVPPCSVKRPVKSLSCLSRVVDFFLSGITMLWKFKNQGDLPRKLL